MSEFLIKAAQLILSLSILIGLHELGHFLPAKWFKTRVEKFYLFFDPYFSIFKIKKGDTEYGIGWIPLGGYVKIAGMIDESVDKEFLNKPAEPWEFRSKPAWQRLIIMIGGVTVNVILGVLIYAGIMFYYGETFLPMENAKYGIMVDSIGYHMGLRNGDKIVTIQNKKIEKFHEIYKEILLNEADRIQIIRDGKAMDVHITDEAKKEMVKARNSGFIEPRIPFTVGDFDSTSPAKLAGMKVDDQIVAINGEPVTFFDEARTILNANKSKTIVVTVFRAGKPVDLTFHLPETGFMGVFRQPYEHFFTLKVVHYSLLQSFPKGIEKAVTTFENYIKQFKLIFSPKIKGYESVGGFASMGRIFSSTWNWEHFWNITAFFSIVLAIMNILPIPALDGGHVMFLLYEIILGRKPSEKFMEYAQYAGMAILFSLMIFANGNDLYRLATKQF
ncbi:MAG: RIP metalloprotease RseP [Bacteroidia bacterium]|nr:RIP metalloprotease RseP [Bacteroidia bacterium]